MSLSISMVRKTTSSSLNDPFCNSNFDDNRYSGEIFPWRRREDESGSILCLNLESCHVNKVHSWSYRRKTRRRWLTEVWIPLTAHEDCTRHWIDCNWLYYSAKWKWIHSCCYPKLQVHSRGGNRRWRRKRRKMMRTEYKMSTAMVSSWRASHAQIYLLVWWDWVAECDLDYYK